MMQLGYLAFEVADPAAWEAFAVGVLGLEVATRGGGGFTLGMDGHKQRFFITPGAADDLIAVGLEVAPTEIDPLIGRLLGAGVALGEADPAARDVARRFALHDPAGVPVEIVTGAARVARPQRFLADDLGLGLVVLGAAAESYRFYTDLLGFKLSDRVVADVHGYKADIAFLHCNPRHHTIALGQKDAKRLHHFMIEALSVDDVGLAFDRALAAGARIMHTLGRHPNDRMLSFYATTPSGFQFEYGWGARLVDDATWTTAIHDRISEWGHHPPQFLRGRK
jgi:2,3-dihydroxybiphenyl 1,2-dioxygenase